jgi:hypothetical protein
MAAARRASMATQVISTRWKRRTNMPACYQRSRPPRTGFMPCVESMSFFSPHPGDFTATWQQSIRPLRETRRHTSCITGKSAGSHQTVEYHALIPEGAWKMKARPLAVRRNVSSIIAADQFRLPCPHDCPP